MWRKILVTCLCGALSWSWSGADAAIETAFAHSGQAVPEQRIALVIGNAAYPDAALRHAVNDARAMSDALRLRGFEVVLRENLTAAGMQQALRDFSQRLEHGGTAMFYFAGHGFRVGDKTLLAAVDADRRAPASLITRGIDLRAVLDSMAAPRSGKFNLLILDTCENNPFGTSVAGQGIFDVPDQTLIAHATAPGALAADGLYTRELLKAMRTRDDDLDQLLHRTAIAVRDASGQRQVPWIASALSDVPAPSRGGSGWRWVLTDASQKPIPHPTASLKGEEPKAVRQNAAGATTRQAQHSHSLPEIGRVADMVSPTQQQIAASPAPLPALQSRGVLPKDSAEQYELTFWDSIKDSTHASDYEAYLQAYPNGRFAALAKARLERLRKAAPKAETPAAPAPAAKVPEPAPKAAPERPRPAPAPKAATKPAPEPKRAEPAAPPVQKQASGATGATEVKDCPTCPELISLPAGSFTMGSNSGDPSEKPAHQVSIATPFAIGKYEITVEQWDACAKAGGCPAIAADASRAPDTPVRDVSWDDAQLYVKWLGKLSGKPYRLPTEAEWEYAARGGSASRYWWGEQMRKGAANCKDCGEPWQADAPAKVGSFAPNPYGLYDMNGSVWEWVSDCWHNNFKGAPSENRSWDESNCRVRVIRGGSWREGASYMPSSTRFKYDASVRHSQNGFRVARDAK